MATRLMFFTRVKFITTFHGTYGASRWWKRTYNRVMLRGPLVIANSDFIRQHIVRTYGFPATRIVVAVRGVDTDVFDPARVTADARMLHTQLGGGAPLLLMVGRITRWKGHDVLLRALAQLPDLPWVLAVAGSAKHGAYLDGLRQLADRLGIADRVRWLGPRHDVAALNMAADVALSCSTQPEAFGRVAIEAMAMGTPVIATAHGGSLETVADGETGRLVPPDDAEALAAALRDALQNPQPWQAMGKAGQARVRSHFTRAHTCAGEWLAYTRLLAS